MLASTIAVAPASAGLVAPGAGFAPAAALLEPEWSAKPELGDAVPHPAEAKMATTTAASTVEGSRALMTQTSGRTADAVS
jgi:hypothetical protein